jgi:hypothetical protein
MLASSAVDRGLEPRSGVCCFSAKPKWSDMSNCGLLFWWLALSKYNLACWSRTRRTSSQCKINLFSPWYSWKNAELFGVKQHSISRYIIRNVHPSKTFELSYINTFLKINQTEKLMLAKSCKSLRGTVYVSEVCIGWSWVHLDMGHDL